MLYQLLLLLYIIGILFEVGTLGIKKRQIFVLLGCFRTRFLKNAQQFGKLERIYVYFCLHHHVQKNGSTLSM